MGTIDEIKKMRSEGMSEEQIRNELRQAGISEQATNEGFAQAKIKDAVSGDAGVNDREATYHSGTPQPGQSFSRTGQAYQQTSMRQPAPGVPTPSLNNSSVSGEYIPEGYEEMQPSIVGEEESGVYQEQVYGAEYSGYPQYEPYSEAMSSDVITEISEQVVSEKLALINDKLKETIDFKTVAESRISSLNERLARIEKIIDRLQLSVLHKVGEYVGDVRDIKHELFETQKSFKALSPGFRVRHGKKKKKTGP